ncbi:MAG: TonB-dependent receptor [Acidobacteria bacterium]|nr:TonB-dependent receptor [Acidobacteriota bacterium]
MKAWIVNVFLSIILLPGFTQNTGTLKGNVTTNNGAAPGVLVTINDAAGSGSYMEFVVTDDNGDYFISRVPAGTYSVEFSATGLETFVESDVTINAGSATVLDAVMVAPLNVMEVLTVTSASRRVERIVEAPAAVSVITGAELERATSHGQLPRLLENQPGVEITQSGAYDFNLNARGFNSSLNRRILVLIDGRDPAVAFLGNQEWSTLSVPLEEFSNMELVRGPGSALYGANAFNGVLNIRTKRPVDTPGGYVTLSGGELSSYRIDARYAGTFGSGWSYRVNGGTYSTGSWSESRTAADAPLEYDGLAFENFALGDEDIESVYFGGRIDKEFENGHVLTFEAGTSTVENALAVTGIGRVQITESERPWFRINYNTDHINAMVWRSERNTPQGQRSLNTGAKLYEDSYQQHAEVQVNFDLFDGKVNLVGGVSYHEQELDTTNPAGFHTLMIGEKKEDQQAAFGQATIHLGDKLDVIVAGRYDESSLHDSQESPKGALVWKINENHSLRATYNQAFQTPNFSEFFLRAAAGVVPFGAIEAALENAFGVNLPLNWQTSQVMALGNPDLSVEQIETYELGYKGIVGTSFFVTADYYTSTATNFVTDLLPGVNPNIPNYTLPEGIPAALQAIILSTLQSQLGGLYNGLAINDGIMDPSSPAGNPIVTLSYTNAGEVDMDGFEFTFNWYVNENWTVDGNYSWFDFDVIDPGIEGDIVPNSPETKYNLGLTYNSSKFTGSMKYKVTDDFPWAAGIFVGHIPSYETLNLNFDYRFTDHIRATVNVINALDDEHYELFGGSVNGRQASGSLHFSF